MASFSFPVDSTSKTSDEPQADVAADPLRMFERKERIRFADDVVDERKPMVSQKESVRAEKTKKVTLDIMEELSAIDDMDFEDEDYSPSSPLEEVEAVRPPPSFGGFSRIRDSIEVTKGRTKAELLGQGTEGYPIFR